VSTIGFEGIVTQGNGPDHFGTAGDTIGSVTFQGFDNTASTQADLEVNWPNGSNWGSGAFLQGPAGNVFGQHITVTLPAGVFAVGTDIMSTDGTSSFAENPTVQLSTGPTVYNAQTLSGFASRGFIGFTSDTQISSITFVPANDLLVLDNFSTGGQGVSPTPEAASLILCGSGLLLMLRLFRRSPNSNAEAAKA